MITRLDLVQALSLSSLVYGDKVELDGLEMIRTIRDKGTDTQGCVLVNRTSKRLFIVFRGTSNERDALTDIECLQQKTIISSKECRIHSGFLKAFESVELQVQLIPFGDFADYEIVICGHSLGGALATICGACLAIKNTINVISFGSPRVGNDKFGRVFNQKVSQYFRFVHHNDVVPMVPKINYRHVGTEILLNDVGDQISYFNVWKRLLYWIKGKGKFNIALFSIEDHLMKNYERTVLLWTTKEIDLG